MKNPLDLLKKIDDLRKDKALTTDVIGLLSIVKSAARETAQEFKSDKDLVKGFDSLDEGLDIADEYLKKGKLSLSTKFSLPFKYKSMKENTQHLSKILEQEDHPVTKSFSDKITTHKDFDDIVVRIHEKANDKMIRLSPTTDGGMEVFELISGQDLCVARLNPAQCDRVNKNILAKIPPKNDKPTGPGSGLG